MKLRYVALSSAVGILALSTLWFLNRRESLETAGNRILAAIEAGDSETLERYLFETERNEVLRDSTALSRLLHEYVMPAFAKVEVVERPGILLDPAWEQGIIGIKTKRSDGTPIALAFTLHEGDKHPVAPYLATQLILFVQEVKYKESDSKAHPAALTAKAWLEGAKRDRAILEEIGVVKMYRYKKDGVLDWDKYIAFHEERVEKLKALKAKEIATPQKNL